jgi:hypothetical protein
VKNRAIFIISLIIISFLSSCDKSSVKGLEEGEIHYTINYIGRKGSIPKDLMPNSMVVKFKNNKILFEITSPIGNNGIFNIVDPDEQKIETFIRLLGLKYYYIGSTGEVPPGIDPMINMELTKTDRKSEIFGLECYHAKAVISDEDYSYDIWYTNEIGLDQPNDSTPFSALDGVLMNFFYKMGEMIVEFEAQAIYIRPVADKDFQKSDKYRQIDRQKMDEIISKLMSL